MLPDAIKHVLQDHASVAWNTALRYLERKGKTHLSDQVRQLLAGKGATVVLRFAIDIPDQGRGYIYKDNVVISLGGGKWLILVYEEWVDGANPYTNQGNRQEAKEVTTSELVQFLDREQHHLPGTVDGLCERVREIKREQGIM